MSKFGAIIEQAKSQNTVTPESQKAIKPESSKTIKPEYKNTGKPEKKHVAEKIDRQVNLSIKIPESRRRHWVAEAKREGTSITAVIIESLSKQFGEPK